MKSFFFAWHRKWLLGAIVLSLLIWGYIYYLLQNTNCPAVFSGCDEYLYLLGAFTWGFFLKSVLVSTLLIFFFSPRAFVLWGCFALVAIPYFIWDITTTKFGSGFGLSFSPEDVSNFDGMIFLGISIFIAIVATVYDFVKKRKGDTKAK